MQTTNLGDSAPEPPGVVGLVFQTVMHPLLTQLKKAMPAASIPTKPIFDHAASQHFPILHTDYQYIDY